MRASRKSSSIMTVHNERTHWALASRTRVMRPLFDIRKKSTFNMGPSLRQGLLIGRSRGSQTNEPHAKHAITSMAVQESTGLNALAALERRRRSNPGELSCETVRCDCERGRWHFLFPEIAAHFFLKLLRARCHQG